MTFNVSAYIFLLNTTSSQQRLYIHKNTEIQCSGKTGGRAVRQIIKLLGVRGGLVFMLSRFGLFHFSFLFSCIVFNLCGM